MYVQNVRQYNASIYKISQADKSVNRKFSQDGVYRKMIPFGSVQGQQKESKYSVCKASFLYLVWTAGYYASC